MIDKIREFIKTVRELIELVELIRKAKQELGPQIIEECNKLKVLCQASSNTADDSLLPLLDKVISFFS